MNQSHPFSYQQVLDSIEELRASLRPEGDDHWAPSTPFWEEGVCPSETWFSDCDFDPRETHEK